jgi:phosphoserine phosphatase RsbU/P
MSNRAFHSYSVLTTLGLKCFDRILHLWVHRIHLVIPPWTEGAMSMHERLRPERPHSTPQRATPARTREAAATQRALMPPPLYTGAFVHAAATMRPCRVVGGDFYDYLDTGREFHVLLGDACGKGTSAALQAALAQGVLAVEVEAKAGAANVVAHLNRALCRRGMADRFVTLFYGVMTRDHGFTYCHAGHSRPMLVNHSSVRRLSVGGIPPGIFGDAVYEEESLTSEPGDTLVVFSDGLSEAARLDQEFGDARILEIVTEHREGTASAILHQLMQAVRDFTRRDRQRDDMSILVVRYLV